MFRFFKKSKPKEFIHAKESPLDMSKVKTWYHGEVICGDYDINDPQGYPYHNLYPHGKGHIVYSLNDKVIEEYKGEFRSGQYHGSGELIDRYGEVFEGKFCENYFVDYE